MSNRTIVKIVEQYCKNNSITLLKLSADWILKLTKHNQSHYIIGYQFDLNSAGTLSICQDKSATSNILDSFNIKNVHHELFMSPKDSNGDLGKMLDFLHTYKRIICKVNNGTGGKDVFYVETEKELEKAVFKIFQKEQYLSLCPFYDIKNEYRAIILNNEVKLIYKKNRPYIIGDGKSTILKLIANNFSNIKKLNLDIKKLDHVLNENEKFYINWKHNLGLGSKAEIILDNILKEKLSKLAIDACKAVNGKFVSVDIVETDKDLKILEINSGIMMENFANDSNENYKIAEKIYGDAIDLMFNNERKNNI